MVPLIFNLGPTELIIILAIVLLLFGGSRLAGLGKSSGRALKEFKEETRGLKAGPDPQNPTAPSANPYESGTSYPPQQGSGPAQQPYGGSSQPYSDPAAGSNYQQPQAPVNPTDRDVRRDV